MFADINDRRAVTKHMGAGQQQSDQVHDVLPLNATLIADIRLHLLELRRDGSDRPLYVTSAGVPIAQAVHYIAAMHGPHRFPSILKGSYENLVGRLGRWIF